MYMYMCVCACVCARVCVRAMSYTYIYIYVYMHMISLYVHVETINCSESCHPPEKHPPWYGPQLEPLDEASTNWGSPFVAGFFPQVLTR